MKKSIVLSSLILAIAFVAVAFIATNSYALKYKNTQRISVTGSAQKNFESDIINWTAQYARKSLDISQASAMLEQDKDQVVSFLISNGIKREDIVVQSVNISRDYEYQYDSRGNSQRVFTGYSLSQSVVVQSKDLDKVEEAAREISSLLSKGIELSSYSPQFFYSDLESLKLDLIKEASDNAFQRANNIASESKAKIESLLQADLGVFQITGQNENEDFHYGGTFNTRSRFKTANITVRSSYRIK